MFTKWKSIGIKVITFGGLLGWVVTMLGFFGVDAKALAQNMSTHYILLIAAIVFFLIFVWGCQYLWKSSRITPGNVHIKIREWLDAFALSVKKVSDPVCHFSFEVTTAVGIPLVIVRTKEHDQYITLAAKIEVSPPHKALFDQLPDIEKARFLHELSVEGAKARIAFSSVPGFGFVTIDKRIPITVTLTEADLLEGIGEINFSVIVIRGTIALALERRDIRPPSPTPDTAASPH
jgi:hypothetical protein